MKMSNMSFFVSESALICNIIGQDIKARIYSRSNPEKRDKYMALKIINASNQITEFMRKYPQFFKNRKLIKIDGSNFCEDLVPAFSLYKDEELVERVKSIFKYEYDLSDEILDNAYDFIQDLIGLSEDSEIKRILDDTINYKNSIEGIWRSNEENIMNHIFDILGYVPEKIGKVKIFVMYPNVNTHRMYPSSKDETCLFLGKRGEKDPNKIAAYLSHQLIHQPMFPYKASMTKEQREIFHGCIKFLADKETYAFLSENSYLDIITEHESAEIMGKIYPFWLGYKYRNADKEGANPAVLIKKDIDRDLRYYNSLPLHSRKKKMASTYNFEMISPEKVAEFFHGKRWMTPYELAQINFDDISKVYKDMFTHNNNCNKFIC